jgi:hypothetical protein
MILLNCIFRVISRVFRKRFATLEVGNLLRCTALAWHDRPERTFASPPPSHPPTRDTLEPIYLASLQLHTLPLYLVYNEHVAYAFHITGEKVCIVSVLVLLCTAISALVYVVLSYFGSVCTSTSFISFFLYYRFLSSLLSFELSFVIPLPSDLYLQSSTLFPPLRPLPLFKLSLNCCLFIYLIFSAYLGFGPLERLIWQGD